MLCAFSCASISKYAPGTSKEYIGGLVLVHPIVKFDHIDSLEFISHPSELSDKYVSIIDSAAKKTVGIIYDQVSLAEEYNEDLFDFFKEIHHTEFGKIWNISVPDCLVQVLDSSQYRYGLIIIGVGCESEKES